MDFLTGVQRLRQECGIPGTGPTAVTSQTGENRRLVDWYKQSLIEIQLEEEYWNFLREDFNFDTVNQQQSYDVVTDIGLSDFAAYRNNSFRMYLASGTRADEVFLTDYPYDAFRDIYLYGSNLTSYGRPTVVSQAPDDSLVFGLPPNDVYTVVGEYYKTPVEVAADTDTPVLPERFHMLIVYAAMMQYASFEAAGEVYQTGLMGYNKLMSRMRIAEGPETTICGSLI